MAFARSRVINLVNTNVINVGYALVGEDFTVIEKASIVIEDGVIKHISKGWISKGITIENGIALPALFNAHVHTGDYAFPEVGLELSLHELVAEPYGLKHRLLRSTPKHKLIESIKRFIDYEMRIGVLAVADFREGGVEGARIALEASRNKNIHYLVLGRPSTGNTSELKELREHVYGLGLSTPIKYSTSELRIFAKVFDDKLRGAHVAEVPDNASRELYMAVEELKANYIVHGVYLTREDYITLADKNIGLIICPRANSWFGVGQPKIDEILDSGVIVALGTDNSGWIKPDIWREMEYTWNIIRLKGRKDIKASDILKMATINPARIFKLQGYGVLEEGYEASLIILDGLGSNMVFAHDKVAGVVKRGGGEHILGILYKGKCISGMLCSKLTS